MDLRVRLYFRGRTRKPTTVDVYMCMLDAPRLQEVDRPDAEGGVSRPHEDPRAEERIKARGMRDEGGAVRSSDPHPGPSPEWRAEGRKLRVVPPRRGGFSAFHCTRFRKFLNSQVVSRKGVAPDLHAAITVSAISFGLFVRIIYRRNMDTYGYQTVDAPVRSLRPHPARLDGEGGYLATSRTWASWRT